MTDNKDEVKPCKTEERRNQRRQFNIENRIHLIINWILNQQIKQEKNTDSALPSSQACLRLIWQIFMEFVAEMHIIILKKSKCWAPEVPIKHTTWCEHDVNVSFVRLTLNDQILSKALHGFPPAAALMSCMSPHWHADCQHWESNDETLVCVCVCNLNYSLSLHTPTPSVYLPPIRDNYAHYASVVCVYLFCIYMQYTLHASRDGLCYCVIFLHTYINIYICVCKCFGSAPHIIHHSAALYESTCQSALAVLSPMR